MEKRINLTREGAMQYFYNCIDAGWQVVYLGASLAILEKAK